MHNRHNPLNTLKVSFIFGLLFLIPLGIWLFQTINADPLASAPVLYQGRYRPFEAFVKNTEERLLGKTSSDPTRVLMLELMNWRQLQVLKFIDVNLPERSETNLTAAELLRLFESDAGFVKKTLPPLIARFIQQEKLPYQQGETVNLNNLAPGLSVKLRREGPSPALFIHKTSKANSWNLLGRGEKIEASSLFEDLRSQQEAERLYRLYQLFSAKSNQLSADARLNSSAELGMRMIPGKRPSDRWLPLSASLSHDPSFGTADFHPEIQKAAVALVDSFGTAAFQENQNALGLVLHQRYQDFLLTTQGSFPTALQLKAELFYIRYDLVGLTAFLYLTAAVLIALSLKWTGARSYGLFAYSLALLMNACLLALRIYILERPPVSNMLESLLFVPFVAAVISLLFLRTFPSKLPLIGGALTASALLFLTRVAFPDSNLENAPAVLNSRFWLIIHVLMVVSSYAFFIVASAVAHVHLWLNSNKVKSDLASSLSSLILIILYTGTFLLISGTILGGVWAQQSWGRFWDWDPKESWAFISSCLYLILIHLYRFGMIKEAGLSMGAIVGALLIGFTWYGVNYLLGTGLHSYGFGSGGSEWFVAFCLAELLFIGLVSIRKRVAA
ncbi:cytochrome c biogenesis protein [Estrella lausannensis]|uniref:Cytochrome c biogenesis protein CcsA n=1 Tax=Estrella lausannensis TaxID=483423 RepID=A0A0H5DRL6_9BACT|nr:cytochrome c biogenesis protein CcsA [Estrella lausannensis]CRX39237.1 Cytochrome c biogenesis protein CcsA [Estrella lausannensis]